MVEAFEKGDDKYELSNGNAAFTKAVDSNTRIGMLSSIKDTIVNNEKVNEKVNSRMPQVGGWANSSDGTFTLTKAMDNYKGLLIK